MFLRNFDNYMLAIEGMADMSSSSQTPNTSNICYGNYTSQFQDGILNERRTDASMSYICPSTGRKPAPLCAGNIVLYDGDTPVTYDDYRMSGNNQLSVSYRLSFVSCSNSTSYDSATNRFKRTLTLTVRNATTSTDYTIKEWGLWNYSCGTSGTASYGAYSNNTSSMVLYFREVLETPITVTAGGTGILTFTFYYPMPNHS